jgi:hypothetical protein
VIFEGWSLRTMCSGDFADPNFGLSREAHLVRSDGTRRGRGSCRPPFENRERWGSLVRGTAGGFHGSFLGSRSLCERLRFLSRRKSKQVPHRAFSPVRNDKPCFSAEAGAPRESTYGAFVFSCGLFRVELCLPRPVAYEEASDVPTLNFAKSAKFGMGHPYSWSWEADPLRICPHEDTQGRSRIPQGPPTPPTTPEPRGY